MIRIQNISNQSNINLYSFLIKILMEQQQENIQNVYAHDDSTPMADEKYYKNEGQDKNMGEIQSQEERNDDGQMNSHGGLSKKEEKQKKKKEALEEKSRIKQKKDLERQAKRQVRQAKKLQKQQKQKQIKEESQRKRAQKKEELERKKLEKEEAKAKLLEEKQQKKVEQSKIKEEKRQKKERMKNSNEGIPQSMLCPITQELMKNPVIISECGHTFQQVVLSKWLKKSSHCPLCKSPVDESRIIKNYALSSLIEDFRKNNH